MARPRDTARYVRRDGRKIVSYGITDRELEERAAELSTIELAQPGCRMRDYV